ncbi:carbohydrate ABC transporter permease [Paenarthrobacter sp. DKR-5]|uniref:carbohydrate ABC transporter permease n=1 Tax=Paenarthrobacter sp. DKR-5 TaxID=2835535 RepID=UPI001BDD9293|nr:carbohydrate ABC transporter permease [Paenarthrobacter sp. DKR-5]MBT1001578.1 carbohydrate ABC transporter permease [Paenarthrobacter sp. DKR-5]
MRKIRKTGPGPVTWALRAVLFLLYGVPILWIVLTSLKEPGDVLSSQASLIFRPTLSAYTDAISNGGLLDAGIQSFVIAAGTTILTLLVAIPAAYGLAKVGGRITTVALGLLIVLQMTPQTATVIPLFQIFGSWGLLDQRIGVIIADTALLVPFAILLLRPFFRAVPDALEEAGAIDGARNWKIFTSIVLPVARNGVATTGTLVFLLSWGEFLYAINFLLSPGSYPLSALLAQQVSAFGINWPGLMALAVITSIPILILFVFTYRLLKEGLTLGAVK